MPRSFLLLTLAICLPLNLLARAATSDIIPAGTLLQCTLDEPNFSSKTAMIGDPILCHLGAINAFGHPAFPRGAMLGGHLEDYKNPGHFVGKGWIQLEFDRLVLPNAQILPLSAKIISAPHMKVDAQGDIHGRGHPKRDAVEWAIPVLWPIKIITLPARGPYPSLKGETRIALRLMEDVEVPSVAARSSIPMPPWAAPSGYHSSITNPAPEFPSVRPAAYTVDAPVRNDSPSSESPATVLVLKDGNAFLARQYWVEGGKMTALSSRGVQTTIALEAIDLYETTRVNRERNIDFVLRSQDAVEQ